MSMNLHMYYGPVFKVKMFNKEFKKNISTCSNIDCKKHGVEIDRWSFCAECGSKIESKDFVYHNESDGLEDLDEKIYDLAVPLGENNIVNIDGDKYRIYVPNYNFSSHQINIDLNEGEFYKPLTEIEFEKIMNDFHNHENYRKIIKEYARHIPDENVVVELSMFTYFI